MSGEVRGTHIAKDVDLTNAELLGFLQDKILTRLTSIDTRLATLNGTVAQNVRDIAATKARADLLAEEQRQHGIKLAVLEERDAHHKERLIETRLDAKDMLAKVWDNTTKIATVVTAVGIMTKLAGLW